ncbi:hypothetical protein LDENG_00165650, partial [Lucifuga dentata]
DTCDLTLDTNTANTWLEISEDNKKVTRTKEHSYPDNPERFDAFSQVMCKEGLTGHCYWEVEWYQYTEIAVAYKGMPRKGTTETRVGCNEMSWALQHYIFSTANSYCARHNSKDTPITVSSDFPRLGVYLD